MKKANLPKYEDPDDTLNGPRYQTGKLCIERCGRPAGTAWSPYWCWRCNADRIGRISRSLNELALDAAREKA